MTRQNTTGAAIIAAIVAALMAIPMPARAQEPVKTFDLLATRLKPGDTVWVTDADGREIKGRLQVLSSASLLLDAGGTLQNIPAARVAAIHRQTSDSLKNGMLWGAAAGFVGGALSCGLNPQCAGDESGAHVTAVLGVMGAAVGAGIGALVDRAIKGPRLEVYRGAGREAPARISLTPIVTARRQGVRLSFSF